MSNDKDLSSFLDDAWQHLRRGVADSRSPARYPAFSTVSRDGMPEVRTVVLRSASQSGAIVEVHTDLNTPKVDALRANAKAALMIWLPKPRLQIRLIANVDIVEGNAAASAWDSVPVRSRVSYGTRPDPGQPIEHAFAYEKVPDRTRFAILRCNVTDIDLVSLTEPHVRAVYQRSEGWVGTWVAP